MKLNEQAQLIKDLTITQCSENATAQAIRIANEPYCFRWFDKDGFAITLFERALLNDQVQLHEYLGPPAAQQLWYTQKDCDQGVIIDHALILHRYCFGGAAKQLLTDLAKQNRLINKIIQIVPKWGIDLSLDWSDENGVMELAHIEFDSYDYQSVADKKCYIQGKIEQTDWVDFKQFLVNNKHCWDYLPAKLQTNWKTCQLFGLDEHHLAETTVKTWR